MFSQADRRGGFRIECGMHQEKIIWIVGATGGIGRELTRRLASGGHRLVLSARSEAPLLALADAHHATAIPFDATDFNATMDAAWKAAEAGLHAVVHLPGAIAAAKAGVEGLVRSAAASYAARGICVNAVAPGMVETPLSEPILSNAQSRAVSQALHPLGRIGQPSDVAAAIEWLAAGHADWVTGAVIPVDGGLANVRSVNPTS